MLLAAPVSAAESVYGPRSPTDPELSRPGPHPVGVRTLAMQWTSPFPELSFRGRATRALTLEVWYPAERAAGVEAAIYRDETRAGQAFAILGDALRDAPVVEGAFPLVVLSHGYTGYRTILFYLGEHLASHGYIVVAPDHPGSTNAEIDSRNPATRRAGFPDTLLHRARDQQKILEWFAGSTTDVARHTDSTTSALIGYSMGGFGGLNTVGGCYRYNKAFANALELPEAARPTFEFCNAGRERPDPRWKALVALAPWGQLQGIHDRQALAGIKLPTLFIAGEEDPLSGYRPGVGDLFDAMTAARRYLLLYENAGHNIAPHPAPRAAYATADTIGHYRESAWDTQTINRINQHIVLAFLDCHLKQRGPSCAMLPEGDVWPGFLDGWQRGLKFLRAEAVD
ncbi:MAG: hypothetical protein RQ729_00655 [Wenzhouxiangellaceae bacterium]|nr:hypothetical protein [Wenzhouxiangellaceae bacterium]